MAKPNLKIYNLYDIENTSLPISFLDIPRPNVPFYMTATFDSCLFHNWIAYNYASACIFFTPTPTIIAFPHFWGHPFCLLVAKHSPARMENYVFLIIFLITKKRQKLLIYFFQLFWLSIKFWNIRIFEWIIVYVAFQIQLSSIQWVENNLHFEPLGI